MIAKGLKKSGIEPNMQLMEGQEVPQRTIYLMNMIENEKK
jgi:hypothetical protein